jgi:hypothetical protein
VPDAEGRKSFEKDILEMTNRNYRHASSAGGLVRRGKACGRREQAVGCGRIAVLLVSVTTAWWPRSVLAFNIDRRYEKTIAKIFQHGVFTLIKFFGRKLDRRI